VTSYEGNGAATKLLQEMATQFNQDAALVMRAWAGDDPVQELTFDQPLKLGQMDDLSATMAKYGFGGWAWFKHQGKTTLRLVCRIGPRTRSRPGTISCTR